MTVPYQRLNGNNDVVKQILTGIPWKTGTAGAVARNEALRASKYLGRAIWRNWSGYHRRSQRQDHADPCQSKTVAMPCWIVMRVRYLSDSVA